MAKKHILDGLIKWSGRDDWAECFEETLEDHLQPACEQTGLGIDEIVETLGEDLFMSTVWPCAFEDFLTREFDDGANPVDDYLKRRGWKETASVRTYMTALRNSTMSLYEVSDVVPGTSFRARDLLRGGEPILISERSASRSLEPWDRIAARVVRVGNQMQVGGGLLVFEPGTTDKFVEDWHSYESLDRDERRKLAEDALGEDFVEAATELSPADLAHASSMLLTGAWLVDRLSRILEPELHDLRNAEGDEIVLCEAIYPLATGTTDADIRAALERRAEFHATSTANWNWVAAEKVDREAQSPEQSLRFETWSDAGELVLGGVTLEADAVVLSTNSRQRADRGIALLSGILGPHVGQPSIETETVEEMIQSRDKLEPRKMDITDEEKRAIIHGQMDRHYRVVLDEPVPALGGLTPRDAVKTDEGRRQVVDWLKLMENSTARAGDSNDPMASYDFGWLCTELGLVALRR